MNQPETKYTKVGDAAVGYQVVGDGPIDLVYVTGLASNIDIMWEWPSFAGMLERLASFSRLILFDARGSGVSDPLTFEPTPTWEYWIEDLRAVLKAAGSERTAFLAQWDGVMRAILFAATYPERTTALVLWGAYGRSLATVSGAPIEDWFTMLSELWGTEQLVQILEPVLAKNPEDLHWAMKYLRASTTPPRAGETYRYLTQLDVSGVLPAVSTPTLVLHRSGGAYNPVEEGRYVADHIDGARFVEYEGASANIFSEGSDEILDEIEEFLTGSRRAVETDRVLATVLFTDIVDSTGHAASIGDRKWKELLSKHDKISRVEIERLRGKVVNTTGDGVVATFDGPGRAIRCAHALGRALEPNGIAIRAGLHTGEIELREEGNVGGIAVHIAARVMAEAGPSEVVCSRTVKDLVAGSEFVFEDRGVRALKGVPDEWQLYAVRTT